jgi:hypothetical protein
MYIVTRFVKLTNDTDAHKGNPIYINVDHITAVYDAAVPEGNIKTFVFGGHTGVQWEVEETPKQVIDLIMPVEYV